MPTGTSEETLVPPRRGPFLAGLLLGVVVTAVTAMGVARLAARIGIDGIGLPVLGIFLLSLATGVAGAMVFLVVQIFIEEEVGVMRRITQKPYGVPPVAMTGLFLF